jgi:hypothetical protein
LIVLFASPILAIGILLLDSGDTSITCGRGGCHSGTAYAITAILVGGGGVLGGFICFLDALFPSFSIPKISLPKKRSRLEKNPYGPKETYEAKLRSMGIAESEIKTQVRKYK